jgi:hypothetical protein
MRVIKTCILKLLVNTDEPQSLRGTLRSVESGDERAFKDGQTLLAILEEIRRRDLQTVDFPREEVGTKH